MASSAFETNTATEKETAGATAYLFTLSVFAHWKGVIEQIVSNDYPHVSLVVLRLKGSVVDEGFHVEFYSASPPPTKIPRN